MSDVVISVQNLTKEYRLGVVNHGTLYHDLQSWWARMRGQEDPNSIVSASPRRASAGDEHFLALDDVSFEVEEGEVLGIIGRNGAGKSTLLKILSRVTAPTKGTVRLKGRVASLLEVGTGFHPELTGRENIYLNGAILGMTRKEIGKKFDEIVAFSEVEKFIDTPVKRYSSGMYVRLAFAVAAHLDPEILIVDEVLAVGDAQFQKKCLGKMGDVSKEGRTVLFVSHNMAAVKRLCSRVIWIGKGSVHAIGETAPIIDKYLFDGVEESKGVVHFSGGFEQDIQFIKVEMRGEGGPTSSFRSDEPIHLKVFYKVKRHMKGVSVAVHIISSDMESLWSLGDWEVHPELFEQREPGFWVGEWIVPPHILRPGRYFVALGAGDGTAFYHHPDPFSFEITPEGAWRPAYKFFGVVGGPICAKMDIKKPIMMIDGTGDVANR